MIVLCAGHKMSFSPRCVICPPFLVPPPPQPPHFWSSFIPHLEYMTSELGSVWSPVHFCPSQIGVWNSQTGLNLTETNKDSSTNVTDSMANRTLIVTTILVRKDLHRCREYFGYFWRIW